ncbi:MAG: hypothetical protein ACO3ZY_09345 [Phycisphaerales bacterium]
MTTTWTTKLIDVRHRRAINDNRVALVLHVSKQTSGSPDTWNPFVNPGKVRDDAEVPIPGDLIGDYDTAAWASVLGTFEGWEDFYRVREVDWSLVANSRSTWQAVVRATNHISWCPEPLIIRSDSSRSRVADRYRDVVPTTSTADGDTITGTAYTEQAGKPEKFQVSQVAVNLTLPWFSDTPNYTDGYPNLPNLVGDRLNRVNSSSFIGFAAKSLMLMGVDVDPVEDEFLKVTVSFLWDGWFHLDQVPDLYSNGDVKVNSSNQAATVKWQKRYQGTTDFGAMFSADEESWAQYGWKHWTAACTNAASAATTPVTKQNPLATIRTAAT